MTALADELDARRDIAAVWGGLTLFGEVEEPLLRRAASLDPWRITYFNTLPYSALYRREALLAVGGWSLPGSFQDWDLWMALAEAGYAAGAVEQPVHRYRSTGRASSRGAPLATTRSTRSCGAVTRACSPTAAVTGVAPPTPGAYGSPSRSQRPSRAPAALSPPAVHARRQPARGLPEGTLEQAAPAGSPAPGLFGRARSRTLER